MQAITDIHGNTVPRWAPRVTKAQITKLYHSVGRGMLDEELIDEVGFALLARCESIIEATEASRGSIACPKCRKINKHEGTGLISCGHCSWTCQWRDYQRTYQKKQLHAGGIEEFLREFILKVPTVKSAGERLVMIDTLIHRFHWENSACPSRAAACNLIEGKMTDIVAFLDQLSYGDHVPPDVEARRAEWRIKRQRAEAIWGGLPSV
jgi:ribosomal protein L37AE/L43A